jgi:hypothetical protein
MLAHRASDARVGEQPRAHVRAARELEPVDPGAVVQKGPSTEAGEKTGHARRCLAGVRVGKRHARAVTSALDNLSSAR